MKPQINADERRFTESATKARKHQRSGVCHRMSGGFLFVFFVFSWLTVTPAQAVQVWVPDTMEGYLGDTIEIPILVSGQTGRNIISADITVGFREDVLTGTGLYRLGNAAGGWMVVINPLPCSLLVAMASANPLGAGDTLLFLKMVVNAGDTSPVRFTRLRLNEGQVPCTTSSGVFYGYATGIEHHEYSGLEQLNLPTVVRGTIRLPGFTTALLLDAGGRQRARLEPGTNDIRHLKPGVYFVRQALGRKSVFRKLIIQ